MNVLNENNLQETKEEQREKEKEENMRELRVAARDFWVKEREIAKT